MAEVSAPAGSEAEHDSVHSAKAFAKTDSEVHVSDASRSLEQNQLRIATIGNVDAGKSTLVGVLTRGITDDGRGKARSYIFHHKHEKDTGRSSAVSVEIMGFHGDDPLPVDLKASRAKLFQQAHGADKAIQFIDLCGHEKYLKTTIFGLTGLQPDYCMVLVGANMGLARITKEHTGIAAALGLPIIVVVTKIDLAPPEVDKATMDSVTKVLKLARKMPYVVRSMDNVDTVAKTILSDKVAPIFRISNVTGEGLPYLKRLLRLLQPRAAAAAAAAAVKASVPHAMPPAAGAVTAPEHASGHPSNQTQATGPSRVPGGSAPGSPERQVSIGDGSSSSAAAATGSTSAAIADTALQIPGAAGAGTSAAAMAVSASPAVINAINLQPAPSSLLGSGVTHAASIDPNLPGECTIDSVFNVPGVGVVVAGVVSRGCLKTGQTVLVGPDRVGDFVPCIIRSIHVHYTPVDVAYPGGSAAFAIRPKGKVKMLQGHGSHDKRKGFVRKGMAVIHPDLLPNSWWEFKAEILVLHHQTTLSVGYAPIIHVGTVVQCASISDIRSAATGEPMAALRTGDRAVITCRFMYRPELLHAGDMLLFREGRAKGVGKLLSLHAPHNPIEGSAGSVAMTAAAAVGTVGRSEHQQ